MGGSKNMGRIVRVRVREGNTGLFYAESSELRGLLVAAPDMSSLWAEVPGAIRDLYEAVGEKVVVTRVEDSDPDTYPFAAIPVAAIPEQILAERAGPETAHHQG